MKKLSVVLVDDHDGFRKAVRTLLSSKKYVNKIFEASNGYDFLEIIRSKKVDIILMDIQMPGMDGIEATIKAKEIKPDLRIIALSNFGEYEYIKSMLNAGACGYLIKNVVNDKLDQAIFLAMGDNCSISVIGI